MERVFHRTIEFRWLPRGSRFSDWSFAFLFCFDWRKGRLRFSLIKSRKAELEASIFYRYVEICCFCINSRRLKILWVTIKVWRIRRKQDRLFLQCPAGHAPFFRLTEGIFIQEYETIRKNAFTCLYTDCRMEPDGICCRRDPIYGEVR